MLEIWKQDAEATCKYFIIMYSKNSNFFYVMDLGNEVHLRNVYWADARTRVVYESFENVVTFDTT